MNTFGNLFLFILATTTLAVTLASQKRMLPNKQPLEPLRDRIEFCSLVQQELRLSATAGLLTESKAEAIVTHCFNTYES